MTNGLHSVEPFSCPYCGEYNSLLLDPQEDGQTLIQDCWVCCRPVEIIVEYDPRLEHYFIQVRTDQE